MERGLHIAIAEDLDKLLRVIDRAPLVQTLALCALKEGNDPHNQEIGLCFLEDYGHSTAHDRDTLLLACAHHTAGHQKFGDPLEAYRRFTEAVPVSTPS